jgi:hypothetical protein
MTKRNATRGALAMAVSGLFLSACATQQSISQQTEQMLVAAGFLEKPANTPKRQARLAALPPYHVLSQRVNAGGKDTVGYVYADPQFCHCVFVGNTEAFQKYQQLAFQAHLVQEQVTAQEMADDNAFGWGDWGPYPYWGGGEVIVARGGFRR